MGGKLLRIQNWEQLARDAKFRPEVVAALCNISLRQLERFSADRFKKSPRELLNERQLEIARILISQGWSNQAVVAELGFANASHFCHKFKRFYGVSPQSFGPIYRTATKTNGHQQALINSSSKTSSMSVMSALNHNSTRGITCTNPSNGSASNLSRKDR